MLPRGLSGTFTRVMARHVCNTHYYYKPEGNSPYSLYRYAYVDVSSL